MSKSIWAISNANLNQFFGLLLLAVLYLKSYFHEFFVKRDLHCFNLILTEYSPET